ncbi:hypothetical protein AQUCO_01000610v1 [Aquilegia coerulea]|uniref:F-box domain-containing protein n=1 Tax=Aquilegia coerulea TaxID=218851 RepID=A0A2G5EAT3_AQUCA|nr:hypothetical protein AQUCO_01000610v1 [Aquilegia coerulea]
MVTSLSDLPTEILSIICEKLVDINDYGRFGDVCKSWRDIVWRIRAKIPRQLPVLMFPNSSNNSSSCMHTHSFYSLSLGKKLIINEGSQFRRCFGSSYGWLITEDYSRMIHLLNPFQSNNNVIKLPCLVPQGKKNYISKAILSHNPSWTSDYVVMLLYRVYYGKDGDTDSFLAILKPGDTYWTRVSVDHKFKPLIDIIYYKDQFYAISCSGIVVFCDINSTKPSVKRVASSPNRNIGREVNIAGESCQAFIQAFLVESSGDLLCVARTLKLRPNQHSSSIGGFQIYKLQTKGWRWIELNTLGGHALFLSNFSTSLLASDFPHCKANHIYSTFRGLKFEMGVFNLADKSIQILFTESIHYRDKEPSHPLWVQPTLNMMRN